MANDNMDGNQLDRSSRSSRSSKSSRKSSSKSLTQKPIQSFEGSHFECYMAVQSGALQKFYIVVSNSDIRIVSIKSGREKAKIELASTHVKILS